MTTYCWYWNPSPYGLSNVPILSALSLSLGVRHLRKLLPSLFWKSYRGPVSHSHNFLAHGCLWRPKKKKRVKPIMNRQELPYIKFLALIQGFNLSASNLPIFCQKHQRRLYNVTSNREWETILHLKIRQCLNILSEINFVTHACIY